MKEVTLWNNPVGEGWQGKSDTSAMPEFVKIGFPRRIKFGLCPGSSDLIGFRSVVVTPEMIGQTIAIFAAIETKSDTGDAGAKQRNFIRHVRDNGGFAGIARNEEEAGNIIHLEKSPSPKGHDHVKD